MESFLTAAEGNVLNLLILILVCGGIGRSAVGHSESLRVWGWRCALVAFLLRVLSDLSLQGGTDPDLLVSTVLRGVVAGAVILGPAWIVLSLGQFLFGNARSLVDRRNRRRRWEQEQLRNEQERLRLGEERMRQNRLRAAAEEERRRQRQELESREVVEQRRRDDVRLECYLLYDRHVNQLQEYFPREMLQEYFDTYMQTSHSATVVETRARLLMEMLRDQINSKTDRMAAFTSLADVAAYFQEQSREIDALPYDEETRESLRFAVNKREDAAIAAFLNRKN
jgi:hypothetical protein